jgi:hypothetical protein
VLVAVPVDELALDHGKSNDAIIHARERLIHPRFIPLTLRGNVDLRQLTVLVVVPDVVLLHRYLPVASQIVSAQIWAGDEARAGQLRCYPVPRRVRPRMPCSSTTGWPSLPSRTRSVTSPTSTYSSVQPSNTSYSDPHDVRVRDEAGRSLLDAGSIPARGPERTSTTDWHGHRAA